MAETRLEDVMGSFPVKNRIVDGTVRLTWNGETVEWAPGEVKTISNKKLADWLIHKSMFSFFPGDVNEGLPSKYHYKLALLGSGQDEHDITKADVAAVRELLDVQNMPQLTRIDPRTGQPMRRVYIDPRSTGMHDGATRAAEQHATKTVSSAIVRDAAEKIADAAQGASEDEIVAAVEDLTGTSVPMPPA